MEPIIIKRPWFQGAQVIVDQLRGTAFTEEDGAHQFRIHGIGLNGEAVQLSGTVLGKLIRDDGVTIDMDGSIESGTVVLTLDGDCYNVPGPFGLTIYLSDGVSTMAVYAAVGNIHRGTTGDELDSGTTVPSLAQLEAAYQGALTVLNKAVLYDESQSLTAAQKAVARANIGLTAVDDGNGNITFT